MMKKVLAGVLAGLLLLATVPAPVPAQNAFYFWTQVRDELGAPIASGVTCQVYSAGGDTPATIYSDIALTTVKANPFTASATGECSWYASASTAVDLLVWNKRGRARHDNFSINDHSTIINKQVPQKVVRIPFATSSTLVSTGVTIPKGAAVRDVLIEVTVAATGAHIAIGTLPSETGGDSGGFCSGGLVRVGDTPTFGKSIESTGWHKCHAVLITGSGVASAIGFVYGAFHSGAYISRGGIGGATSHAGSYVRFPYVGDGVAKTVSYMTTPHTVAGHFYLIFDELGND